MITSETLRLDPHTPDRPTLYLGPFGKAEFEAVLPLQLEGLQFPKTQLESLAEATAEELVDIQDSDELIEWGVYQERIEPASFLGCVGIEEMVGENGLNDSIKEVSSYLIVPEARGKGIGSLATLAMIAHDVERSDTQIFQAMISEQNKPCLSLFAKIGFTFTGCTVDYYDLVDDALAQEWLLVSPAAQTKMADGDEQLAAFAAGWQRYEAQLQTLHVVQIDR